MGIKFDEIAEGYADTHWSAFLGLCFEKQNGRSYVQNRRHYGPLLIQRPFYPEGGLCHTYLLHPPAGVVGGDELRLEVHVKSDAQALMTTPSANKFYSSSKHMARVEQHFRVDEGASLEWLPQETILFENARATLDTHIELRANARYLGWEIVCLGRPAAGTEFGHGYWCQHLDVRVEGCPKLIERLVLNPDDPILESTWGLGGKIVSGTLICTAPDLEYELDSGYLFGLDEPKAGMGKVTYMDGLLIARYLGMRSSDARDWFESLWAMLRPKILGVASTPPRIWLT